MYNLQGGPLACPVLKSSNPMKQLIVNHNLFGLCHQIGRINEYLTKKVMSRAFAPVVKQEIEETNHCMHNETGQKEKPATDNPFVYGKTGTPINSLFI